LLAHGLSQFSLPLNSVERNKDELSF